MSLERANDNGVFTAESYRRNVQTIQAMEDQLKWMKLENEKAELERKVREGETAREQLVQLQGQMTATAPGNVGNANVSNGPSIYPVQPSAYIEEVGYDNQPSSSRPTPNHSQRYHPRPNGNMNYSSIPPIAVNNSANVARHHPHMHRQTTFIPGSSPSDTNSIRPVH
ncbi:uncharacterized protein BT62DRAFT_782756 [Guyanagaster necrorhizus]|uniref:Uncharacterized protein n=1 Tax=Guyanagaster necrorhizus TaxID=856835 RepID=A0A9P7VVS3_9AGAR|nr:uncharacterized protein BT62DRAFT_782756 [Guyanagaster necrorhizus MCA 3950]KAG7447580.1 hypothetical protein BT62DRAFT_782756 [Guyanagaster necrorhizus MCA 3950]